MSPEKAEQPDDHRYAIVYRPSEGPEKGHVMHLSVRKGTNEPVTLEEANTAARDKSLEPGVRDAHVIDYNNWRWAAQEHWKNGEKVHGLIRRIREKIKRNR